MENKGCKKILIDSVRSVFTHEKYFFQDNEEFKEIERKFSGVASHPKRRSSESSEFDTGGTSKASSGRIKHYRYKSPYVQSILDKKPKDLKRAIGKIEKDDWNIKSIEEKLLTKKDPISNSEKDKIPKWSNAAFQDKFNIMKGKLDSQTTESIDAGKIDNQNTSILYFINTHYKITTINPCCTL